MDFAVKRKCYLGVSAICLALLVLMCMNSFACADDMPLKKFFNDVFQVNPVTAKWNVDIRYNTIGLNEEDSILFDRAAARLSEVLDVGLSREETNVNVLFVFSVDMDSDLRRENIFKLFRNKNESYEAYLSRVIDGRGEDNAMVKANVGKDSIHNFISIAQIDTSSDCISMEYNRILIRMLFGVLSLSNVEIDSVLSVSAGCSELTEFDLRFVDSYYSDKVQHGMSVEETKRLLVNSLIDG